MKTHDQLRGFQIFLWLFEVEKQPQETLDWHNMVGIVEHFENQILATSKVVIHGAKFVALTCDDVTTTNNSSWIYVHGYCVQD